MTTDTAILATAWINQPRPEQPPAQTLLVGAAVLAVSYRFGTLAFDLATHSTTVTDDPVDTMAWLADRFHVSPARLLLWRASDIVVPSLIAAAETTHDAVTGARLLHALALTLTGEVIDVATGYGGSKATSFDAVAHGAGLPFVPLPRPALAEAHRSGNHGLIRDHLAERCKTTWRLWLAGQADPQSLAAATEAWVSTSDARVRL